MVAPGVWYTCVVLDTPRLGVRFFPSRVMAVLVIACVAVLLSWLWSPQAAAQGSATLTILTDAPDDPAQSFSVSVSDRIDGGIATEGGESQFHQDSTSFDVTPGRYWISLERHLGWKSTLDCTPIAAEETSRGFGYRRGHYIDLPAGANVVCTHTAEYLANSSITVVTNAPDDPSFEFGYGLGDDTAGPPRFGSIDQSDGESTSIDLLAGLYNLDGLDQPFGWVTSYECLSPGGSTFEEGLYGLLISVVPGDDVVCTYTHEYSGTSNLNITYVGYDGPEADQGVYVQTQWTPEAFFSDGNFLLPGGTDNLKVFADTEFNLRVALASEQRTTGPRVQRTHLVPDISCVGETENLGWAMDQVFGTIPPGGLVECQMTMVPAVNVPVLPVVSCLAGNGRIDVNVFNDGPAAAVYEVQVGNLSPRVRNVQAADWWRSPVTGRPNGDIDISVHRNGELVLEKTVGVACFEDSTCPSFRFGARSCDGPPDRVASPEVAVYSTCRGGSGFVLWQFVNGEDRASSYVIEFEGVPNRSTSASRFGASVRGVSGRPNGTYDYLVRKNGTVLLEGSVDVNCND